MNNKLYKKKLNGKVVKRTEKELDLIEKKSKLKTLKPLKSNYIQKKKSSLSGLKKPLKQKSYKLAKLEKNRYSIMTDKLDHCYICESSFGIQLHEVYFGSKHRKLSMEYGCVLPLCDNCHKKIHADRELNLFYKELVQKKFEENSSRKEFVSIFGRSYIK